MSENVPPGGGESSRSGSRHASSRETKADFDWPTRVTRVSRTWYSVYAAHAVPRE